MIHQLQFHHDRATSLPICSVCLATITADQWLDDEACPGRLMCWPPAVHVFTNDALRCLCGHVDYGTWEHFMAVLPKTVEIVEDAHGQL